MPMFFSYFDGLSGQFQKLKSKKGSKNCAKLLKTTRGTWKILRNQHIVSKSCEIMPHFWKMSFFFSFFVISFWHRYRHRHRPIFGTSVSASADPMFFDIGRTLSRFARRYLVYVNFEPQFSANSARFTRKKSNFYRFSTSVFHKSSSHCSQKSNLPMYILKFNFQQNWLASFS